MPRPINGNPNERGQRQPQHQQPQGLIIGYKVCCPMCGNTDIVMRRPDGQMGNIMFCCGQRMKIAEPIYK